LLKSSTTLRRIIRFGQICICHRLHHVTPDVLNTFEVKVKVTMCKRRLIAKLLLSFGKLGSVNLTAMSEF